MEKQSFSTTAAPRGILANRSEIELLEKRHLGSTGLSVTPLCVGTSPLSSMAYLYGYEVSAERAVATMRRVLQGPIMFIDTGNNYGNGDGERRVGIALNEIGGLPEGFVLATKVDPAAGSKDFSGIRVRQSLDESLERLGVSRLQLVYLHDPEKISFETATAPGGPVEALLALRDDGRIGHLGVAGGPVDLMRRYVATGAFDVVLTHNRFTLVDRSAERLLRDAAEAGVAVVNGAPFGGGMLAKGPEDHPLYAYRPPADGVIQAARAMRASVLVLWDPARCCCSSVLYEGTADCLHDRWHLEARASATDTRLGQLADTRGAMG